MYLSLPLVEREERVLTVTLVFEDAQRIPVTYGVAVHKHMGTVRNLKENLAKLSGTNDAHLHLYEVFAHRFHKRFQDDSPVSDIYDGDTLVAYELAPSAQPKDDMIVGVVHRYQKQTAYNNYYASSSRFTTELFGTPLLLRLSATHTTAADLSRAILARLEPRSLVHRSSENDENVDDALESAYHRNLSNKAGAAADVVSAAEPLFDIGRCNMYATTIMQRFDVGDPHPLDLNPKREPEVFVCTDWDEDQLGEFSTKGDAACVDDPSVPTKLKKKTEDRISLYDCLALFQRREKLNVQNMW
jgi:hypothetical protein